MVNLNRHQRVFIFKAIVSLFLLAIVVFIFAYLKAMIFPALVGALLAYLFKPLLSTFKYPWLPEGIRVGFLVCLFIGAILAFTYFVKESLPNEKGKLELLVRMQYKINEKTDELLGFNLNKEDRSFVQNFLNSEFAPILTDLNKYFSLNPKQAKDFEDFYKKGEIPQKFYEYYESNNKHKIINREVASQTTDELKSKDSFKLAGVINALSIWIVMPLVFIFLLFDKGDIYNYLVRFIPNRYFELTLTVFEQVDVAIGKYLRGTLLQCACVGLTMMIGFYFIGFGLKAAFLIGIIAGLTNAIPFLGPAVALAIGLGYGIIAEDVTPVFTFISLVDILIGIFIVVMAAQVLDNVYFQPVIVGAAVNLHPLVVLLSVFGGSVAFGFAGILLAIPTVVVIKTTCEALYRGLRDYYII